MSSSDASGGTGGAPGPGGGGVGSNVAGELKIIKTQLIPLTPTLQQHQLTAHQLLHQHSSPLHSPSTTTHTVPTTISTTHSQQLQHPLSSTSLTHPTPHISYPLHMKNCSSSFSLNTVAAKITHVKTTTIDGGLGTIMTSGISTPGGFKVATSNASLALSSSQPGTAFRAIGAGGQSTQVRVVMPPGTIMPQSMIKQFEGVAASGRTQITAIPAARTVSNTSITVTRPVTQTTYLPRAGVTATQMTGIGVTTGQRLVTPIRTTPVGSGAITGLTTAGSFVRSTSVNRTSSAPATTVISPATSTTWMAANTSGQVQLIRAIPHQPRQRLITTQGITSISSASTATSGTVVATTATLAQGGGVVGGVTHHQQAQQVSLNQSPIQSVSAQQAQQQTFVATLATVLPPRQQTATLVYSSNNVSTSSQQQAQTHQFNPTVTGQRFAVATSLTAATGTGAAPRQIRPISLPKSFSATKLNTTSISIRSPNLPQLTPTLATSVSAANSPRSNTIAGQSTGNVIPTTNLSTTRIIQLQQQPGGTTQQLIGSTGRLASNVMLQPIIVNTTGAGKIGIRPPVTMATKVQPSLTITQLGIGKIPGTTGSNIGGLPQQQNLTASIQTINSANSGNVSPSMSTVNASINASNLATATQLMNVTQGANGQLLATAQNVVSSAAGGATVVPLAITTRGGAGGNILTGTITPIKHANGITVGKVNDGQSLALSSGGSTSVFIHHTAAPQRPHSGSGATVAVATNNVITSGAGTSSSVITAGGNTTGSNTTSSTASSFLPAGSTFYYESVPASSVQVSTGVLSLTTSTVSSSTMSQNQIAASNLAAITSMPFSSHGSSTATYTVVPSTGGRTIGQLQIPVSSGGTQLQAVPVRFSAQLAPGSGACVTEGTHIASTLVSSSGQQILIPAQQQSTTGQQQPHHMVIPLQTSIKVTSSGSNAGSVVSSFFRKRDAESSPVRAAKNLAPTFLSMNSNIINVAAAPQLSSSSTSSGTFVSNSISTSNATAVAVLSNEAFSKKERVIPASTRPESPASSDGSTTVSANSSPGIEQQIQDGNLVLNRMAVTSDSTHFNPINELYSNHHSTRVSAHQHFPSTSANSRNSSLDHQQHLLGSQHQQLLNGSSVIDCPPRKKARRSTNDSQHSTQSQTSLSLPPPIGSVGNNIGFHGTASTILATDNGPSMLVQGSNIHEVNNVGANHKSINNNQVISAAEYKENTKPTEYVLRKPRNCTLLNTYKQNWKAASNHFQRYSDIKPREERRPTVIDLANQANVLGKINGWKIYHLRSQMEDLCENESLGYDKLSTMLKQMESHGINTEIERISDLLKGNMQRSKIIVEGVNEAQNQIMKIFEHKSHISDIIHRCASKRNFKKREKV